MGKDCTGLSKMTFKGDLWFKVEKSRVLYGIISRNNL